MTIEKLQQEMRSVLRTEFTTKQYVNYATRRKAAQKELWRIALVTLDKLGMPDYHSWLVGFEDLVIAPFMGRAMDKMTKERAK